MKKTHDYVHYYRGYWSDGGKCRIHIYQEEGQEPVVVCSQLPENKNTSVTNMAEYLAAEVMEEHGLATSLTWIEHYPEHRGKPGEYSLVVFSSWEVEEVCLGGVWRYREAPPEWSPMQPREGKASWGRRRASGKPTRPHRGCFTKPYAGPGVGSLRVEALRVPLIHTRYSIET